MLHVAGGNPSMADSFENSSFNPPAPTLWGNYGGESCTHPVGAQRCFRQKGLAPLESSFFILQVLFVTPACGISREVNKIGYHYDG